MRICSRCRVKHAQGTTPGLCRGCARALGEARTTRDFDARRIPPPPPRKMDDAPPRAPRIVTINGVEYEITWPR